MICLPTGSGGERQLPLLPRAPPPALAISPCFSLPDPGGSASCRSSPGPPHQLLQSHRTSPYRIRGGATGGAPPPGPPTSSCNLTALLLTGSGGERQLSLLPRAPPPALAISPHFSLPDPGGSDRRSAAPGPPHQLLQSHRTSPYRIRGGAPAVAPPPGPPTSSCNLTALLLTGSGGERPEERRPRAPPPALAISPHFSLPDPGGSASCRSSPGPPHQLLQSHRTSPYRIRGGAPAAAPPPGPPTSSCSLTALLLAVASRLAARFAVTCGGPGSCRAPWSRSRATRSSGRSRPRCPRRPGWRRGRRGRPPCGW